MQNHRPPVPYLGALRSSSGVSLLIIHASGAVFLLESTRSVSWPDVQGRIKASAGPAGVPKMRAPPQWAHIFAFTVLTVSIRG